MISIEQIRGARGLLDWTQDDLAKAAGVSKPAVNNIERRLAKPRSETLQAIRLAFERAGIEFIDNGARFRGEILSVQVIEGSESVPRFLQDVLDTVEMHPNKEVLISGIQEQKFVDVAGENFFDYLRKVKELGVKEKLLALENDDFFVTDVENYRWVPAHIFSQVPYFVYGDKYAMVLWGPPQKIVMIESDAIAESFRRQFYAHWGQGKFPVVKEKS